ncbi:MAG: CBS domain-containing protein [Phaeodactylibacter sp.]|nr:CBS domain-containing protein [Phaeodactylibacter sp.]MCB9293349.1 CBS domain-containing protein [Lewinellaceae bacterium]
MDLKAPVSTIMTTDLKTAGPEDATTVLDDIFKQNRFHHVPIVNDEKRVVGIISKSDFLYLLRGYTVHETDRFRESAKLRGFKVKEIMHGEVVTIREDTSIREAVALLSENRFRSLPVVNSKSELVGIVTTHDIIDMVNELED